MAMSGILGDDIIKLVETQVKDQGGILGGREVDFVKYDDRASVPEAAAGALKLYEDDKVSAIVWGGVSETEMGAVSTFADENKILFCAFGNVEDLAKHTFTVDAVLPPTDIVDTIVNATTKLLKPSKVGFLARDVADVHDRYTQIGQRLKAAGMEIVYNEYVPPDTTDFTPYLTKIKYENPDVLIIDEMNEGYLSIAKQITDLGGLGNIKVLAESPASSAAAKPGADGWYIQAPWDPNSPYPGSVKFVNDFKAIFNRAPNPNQVYYYNAAWTAIYAIEMAGTDTDQVKIAQAARSGNLEWDSPMGHARFNSNGDSGLHSVIVHVEGGKLVGVPIPD